MTAAEPAFEALLADSKKRTRVGDLGQPLDVKDCSEDPGMAAGLHATLLLPPPRPLLPSPTLFHTAASRSSARRSIPGPPPTRPRGAPTLLQSSGTNTDAPWPYRTALSRARR